MMLPGGECAPVLDSQIGLPERWGQLYCVQVDPSHSPSAEDWEWNLRGIAIKPWMSEYSQVVAVRTSGHDMKCSVMGRLTLHRNDADVPILMGECDECFL